MACRSDKPQYAILSSEANQNPSKLLLYVAGRSQVPTQPFLFGHARPRLEMHTYRTLALLLLFPPLGFSILLTFQALLFCAAVAVTLHIDRQNSVRISSSVISNTHA